MLTDDPFLTSESAAMTLRHWIIHELGLSSQCDAEEKIKIDISDRGLRVSRHDFPGHEVFLEANFYILQKNTILEILRKILVKLHAAHDYRSISALSVLRRQISIRTRLCKNFPQWQGVHNKRAYLLRVDDFPSGRCESESFLEFHKIAYQYKIPYLLAVTPFLMRPGISALTMREIEILKETNSQGVNFALHGFSHERRHLGVASELAGMPNSELKEKIKLSKEYFNAFDMKMNAFVAPFNGFDVDNLAVLTKEFSVICGGPESVSVLGYRGSGFLGQAYYIPSYRFAYDLNSSQLEKLICFNSGEGGFVPISLHWANEKKEGFRFFKYLCQKLQGQCLSWDRFIR